MRTLLAILVLLELPGCSSRESLPTSTALPRPVVSLVTNEVLRDHVLLVWSVRDGESYRYEILRQNRSEPWKHLASAVVQDGRITIEDAGVVPGERYRYRLRIVGAPIDSFLDETEVEIPL
jgi:hypothetical protein